MCVAGRLFDAGGACAGGSHSDGGCGARLCGRDACAVRKSDRGESEAAGGVKGARRAHAVPPCLSFDVFVHLVWWFCFVSANVSLLFVFCPV